MPIGLPAEEAVAIFNALTRFEPANVEEIARSEWRLRNLARQRPGDDVIGVARLQALVLLGRAQEAITLADQLWHRRNAMGPEQVATFVSIIAHLGMYERTAEIIEAIKASGGENVVEVSYDAAEIAVAWWAGDLDRLSASRVGKTESGWRVFIEEIKQTGLAPHLAGRQKIVREKLYGRQCFSQFVLSPGEGVPIEMAHFSYIAAPYDERVALEEEIQQALNGYFDGFGLGDLHWSVAPEIVAPMTAGPPWHRDFYTVAA